MTGRDDLEHRLSRGLKRWAQAGEPTMDLEAYVRERLGQGSGSPEPLEPEAACGAGRGRRWRRWLPWLGGAAVAAVALVVAGGVTFPRWAGAATGLPLLGPVVTRMILDDAGLKWAYDMGLIGSPVAEATQNGITVRVLGVLADARRTTVLYQVQGAPPSEQKTRQPGEASSWLSPPQGGDMPVDVTISGAVNALFPPEETPLGYIGTVSTTPLEAEKAELEVTFRVGGETITLTVPASREETDRFSREVPVNQTVEHDGVRITVESVIYTPAETIVRYREEGPDFHAPVQWNRDTQYDYLDVSGRRYRSSGVDVASFNDVHHLVFPPVRGPARLVLKPVAKGIAIDAVWPLEPGAVVDVMGVPVTLMEYERTPGAIGFRWQSPDKEGFLGIAEFEVLDSAGNAHPLNRSWSTVSNWTQDGVRRQHYGAELPEGVEPVAVRARQAGVFVEGPWVFDLPRP